MPSNTPHPRAYDLLSAEPYAKSLKRLPTRDELAEVESTLSGVCEFLVEPMATAVAVVAQAGDPGSVSYEDIGRLVTWASNLPGPGRFSCLSDETAKITVAALESHTIAEGFDYGADGVFDEKGRIEDRDYFDRLRRRHVGA